MCLCVPGLTGRGKEKQQNAAEYSDIKLFFCLQEPMPVVSNGCNPLKVNANSAFEEFLYSGGRPNSEGQVVR